MFNGQFKADEPAKKTKKQKSKKKKEIGRILKKKTIVCLKVERVDNGILCLMVFYVK